jgi:hypothetical protein
MVVQVQPGQVVVVVVLVPQVVPVQRMLPVVPVEVEQHQVLQEPVSHMPVAAAVVHIVAVADRPVQQGPAEVVLADIMPEAVTVLLIPVAVAVADQTTTAVATAG